MRKARIYEKQEKKLIYCTGAVIGIDCQFGIFMDAGNTSYGIGGRSLKCGDDYHRR